MSEEDQCIDDITNFVLLAPFLACLHANKERKDTKHMGGDANRLTLLHVNNKYRRPVCVSVQIRLGVHHVSFIVRLYQNMK